MSKKSFKTFPTKYFAMLLIFSSTKSFHRTLCFQKRRNLDDFQQFWRCVRENVETLVIFQQFWPMHKRENGEILVIFQQFCSFRHVTLSYSAKPKVSVFKNFFLSYQFKKKCKMICGKTVEIFFDTQRMLCLGDFFEKKIQKKLG